MIKIVAKLPVLKDRVEEFKQTAKELVEQSRAEEGNVFYSLNVSKADPNLLVFIENWKDQDAIDVHNATAHFTTILPKLTEMCDGEVTIELFDEVVY